MRTTIQFIQKKINMNAHKLLRNWKQIKAKYPDALLLFRSESHYIALNDDAKTVAQICGTQLNNTLTQFEYHKLDYYLPKLVRSGHKVAVCEELPKPETK